MKTNIICAIQLFFLAYFVTICSAGRNRFGGLEDMDPNDPIAIEIGVLGVQHWQSRHKNPVLIFKSNISAKQQFVNGMNYRIASFNVLPGPPAIMNRWTCDTQAHIPFGGMPVIESSICRQIIPF